jgi:2'-5' RNA ligase
MYHPPSTFHITIKSMGFVGTQVEQRNVRRILQYIKDVALSTRPFDVRLDGLSTFPDVVYAKITSGNDDIVKLNESLAEGLKGTVIQGKYEGRDMTPHVTLATFTASDVDELLAEVRRASKLKIGEFRLDRITVVKASLKKYYGPSDARANSFDRVASFPFGSAL